MSSDDEDTPREAADEEASAAAEVSTPKKRPGRPRKYPVRTAVRRLGIVKAPINAEEDERRVHSMELFYDNPGMFKRIFQTLKTMGAGTVRVRFDCENVKLYTEDHLKASKIYARIFGRHMVRYYCRKPYEIELDVNFYGKVFQTVTQDYHTVSFVANRELQVRKMQVGFEIGACSKTSMFSLDVVEATNSSWAIEDLLEAETTYPIHFCLDAREFKKHVTDGKTLAETLSFEKKGQGHLRINYEMGGRGRHCFNYIDEREICLQATNGEENVRTVLNVDYLKPLSAAMVADKIWLSVGNEEPLISTFYLDHDMDGTKAKEGTHKCEIKILTTQKL